MTAYLRTVFVRAWDTRLTDVGKEEDFQHYSLLSITQKTHDQNLSTVYSKFS